MIKLADRPEIIAVRRRRDAAMERLDAAVVEHNQACERMIASTDRKDRVARQIKSDRDEARRTGRIPVLREIVSGVFSLAAAGAKK